MTAIDLRDTQEPIKHAYEENPELARVALTATGAEATDVRSCNIDIGRAIYEAELHEGVGGPGAGACSGDLLLGALAACAQLTAQAVADNFGLDIDVSVEATGELDLRGTLGIDDAVPVGFEDIGLAVSVTGEINKETRSALEAVTEKYCVVYQTLTAPPPIQTTWSFEGSHPRPK